jgi:hypothetical protein
MCKFTIPVVACLILCGCATTGNIASGRKIDGLTVDDLDSLKYRCYSLRYWTLILKQERIVEVCLVGVTGDSAVIFTGEAYAIPLAEILEIREQKNPVIATLYGAGITGAIGFSLFSTMVIGRPPPPDGSPSMSSASPALGTTALLLLCALPGALAGYAITTIGNKSLDLTDKSIDEKRTMLLKLLK